MTTTAYPPSTGGVQAYIQDLRSRLQRFEADVAALWDQHRTDWLFGTTLRLGETNRRELAEGVYLLGWSGATRARMAPWTLAYYAIPSLASRRIAARIIPYLDKIVSADHVLIHNHRIGREFLAYASLVVARKRRVPFVLTPYHHPRWRGYRYRGWTNVYLAADAVLTLTETELRELARLGVPRDRLHNIGGAAEEPLEGDARRFRSQIGGSKHPLVLFIGQLYEYKGVAELAEAADGLHARGMRFELVFIGPETPFSRSYFKNHQRPWLHVLGTVDAQTKWDGLEAATVVCVPSLHESFGRVYVEAWSKSKPVIGCRIPAVCEVVTDGDTGLLVDPGSTDQLTQAIERLLTDSELSARLGSAGRQEVRDRFSWQKVVARVEAAYDSVLEGAGKVAGLR